MNEVRYIGLFFLLLLAYSSDAQESDILDVPVDIQFRENSLQGHVDNLILQDITLAFNSSNVELDEIIVLSAQRMKVIDIITELFDGYDYEIIPKVRKVILQIQAKQKEYITIRGYIKDSQTGEILVGASVVDLNTYNSTFSNEAGFYSLTIPKDNHDVLFSYIGYKSFPVSNASASRQNVNLEFDNQIAPILIKGLVNNKYIPGSGSEKIDISLLEGFTSVSGENDLLTSVRIDPAVQSGNEAQSGLYVRGGSPDQNLILLEGVPLYEVNHTAGFSSMFIEESILNADFIKNGFPARYGGRLSSVLNVQLKEGDKSGYHGDVQFSIPGAKAHIEGPLFSENTTFNLSGRVSYVDTYINELLDGVINYDNIILNYYDIVGKVTHNFSPTTKVSFSIYDGGDNLGLSRALAQEDEDGSFATTTDNSLKWGSKVWNATFSNVVNDKLLFKANLGSINYGYTSRGSYTFESITNGLESNQEVDVISSSDIVDYVVGIHFDYYMNDNHRLKFGGGWYNHKYNPAVVHNTEIINGEADSLVFDENNNILADEFFTYIEDTYTPAEKWQIYGGLHISGYNIGTIKYRNWQPRFRMIFSPNNSNRISLSYSKMAQYIHLLVNPGIGLPSDLWVPSTDQILPELADQISASYSFDFKKIQFSLSGYYKDMDNLLEYSSPVDLFFTVINSNTPPNIRTDPDWTNRVVSGTGSAFGLEVSAYKSSGDFTGWLSYGLSKSTREFPLLNDGKPFPYKYDRRHDLNIGLQYKFNSQYSVSSNFVYGTGNHFSLAIEEFETIFTDIKALNSDARNNFQYPAFHHLDVQFNYNKKFENGHAFNFNLGLYNTLNRKNAYYVYIVSNPLRGVSEARKTSIFPILPNLSIGYTF